MSDVITNWLQTIDGRLNKIEILLAQALGTPPKIALPSTDASVPELILLLKAGPLNDWEKGFVATVEAWRGDLTAKMQTSWDRLVAKHLKIKPEVKTVEPNPLDDLEVPF